MSDRLRKLVNEAVLKGGPREVTRLADLVSVKTRMIHRYRKGLSRPPTDKAHALAKELGCTDGEALQIASECDPCLGQRTA